MAVIGAGRIAEQHLSFLKTARQRIVGLCDLSPARASYQAAQFGAERAFADYRQMLAETKPDVVHVLTPPHTHVAIAKDCLRAGAHVIVEKPIALSHADFVALWKAAEQAGKLLIEDHNYRFSPGFQELERFVRSGALGNVKRVDIDFTMDVRGPNSRYTDRNVPNGSHKMPAGVVHEFLPHIAYLALRFLPAYERVRASWWNAEQDDLFKFDSFEGLLLGKSAAAHLRFTAHSGPNRCVVRVHGTRGWADTDILRPALRAQTQGMLGPLSFVPCHIKNGVRSLRAAFGNAFAAATRQSAYKGVHVFLAKTYHALRTGSRPPVTFSDMDCAMKLSEDLLRRENRL